MNRLKAVFAFAGILFFAQGIFGQEPVRTKHYEIVSGTEQLGQQMETLFEVYNRVFMFDPEEAALPLRVRVFSGTDEYNDYARSMSAVVSPGAMYLHYVQSGRRELILDGSNADNSLPYQAFIQYLRAFVAQPPYWMQKGFAEFFRALSFTADGVLDYEENLSWLQPVRKMKSRPKIEGILTAESGGVIANSDEFAGLACSLVSFFLNSGKEEYTRSFTDSIMTLSNENSSSVNAASVMKRLLLGRDSSQMSLDYERYINSRKTFSELVSEGQKAYSSGDSAGAKLSFLAALELKSSHHVPYYYLGLLAYNADKYDEARENYLAAIENGAEKALVFYALGINAAAAKKIQEAVDYLRRSGEEDPKQYKEKTDKIRQQLTSWN
ncbi:MAG: tetratricopeptide repeat protein [Treponema sp.]|nr:tetratricopeptide repeat protein [Treponema sp.]